jgi:hypothetical protein
MAAEMARKATDQALSLFFHRSSRPDTEYFEVPLSTRWIFRLQAPLLLPIAGE